MISKCYATVNKQDRVQDVVMNLIVQLGSQDRVQDIVMNLIVQLFLMP